MIIERIHPQVIKYAVMKLKTIATNAMISTVTMVLFFHHLTQVDILIYSCPRTGVIAVALIVAAHVTIERDHAVCAVRRVLGTRPIEVRRNQLNGRYCRQSFVNLIEPWHHISQFTTSRKVPLNIRYSVTVSPAVVCCLVVSRM